MTYSSIVLYFKMQMTFSSQVDLISKAVGNSRGQVDTIYDMAVLIFLVFKLYSVPLPVTCIIIDDPNSVICFCDCPIVVLI